MLSQTLVSTFSDRFAAHAARVRELAAPLSNTEFWQKPFPFGNSFGHLVLHLTGNLNYYIGAQVANTGYIRDRPREFNDANPPSKDEALGLFNDAVDTVLKTLHAQSDGDWQKEYSAMGTTAPNRLAIFLVCESHLQHHIGQMIYLTFALQRQA